MKREDACCLLLERAMTKVVMLFWVLSHSGEITEPQRIEGFKTIEACEVAAESLTESNPKEKATYRYAVVAQCLQVPK